jgi:predicted RNA-binding Zn ribbon-like protein
VVTEYHGSGNLSKIIERLPVKFIGGRLCLDFVNTVSGRDPAGAAIRDKIASYEDWLAWSVLAGILDRRRAGALARLSARDAHEAAKADILARGIQLREALYRIFKCLVDGGRPRVLNRFGGSDDRGSVDLAESPRLLPSRDRQGAVSQRRLSTRRPAGADVEVLRQELSIARAHQRFAEHDGRFVWTFPEPTEALDRFLWPVALSAAELLTSSDLERLGQCGGADCGWIFLDTSRNRRRQWCTMQDCGNRAKVQKFRQKQRGLE